MSGATEKATLTREPEQDNRLMTPGPDNRPVATDMKRATTVSVVIPAYNEKRNLARVVRQIMSEPWSATLILHEVLIINDCSDDGTPAIADGLAGEFERVRVIHHTVRSGKNAGMRTGVAASQSDVLIFVDADVSLGARCLTEVSQMLADDPSLMAASCIFESVAVRSWRERASRFQLLFVAELGRRGQGSLARVYAVRATVLRVFTLPDGTHDDLFIARWLLNHGHRFAVRTNAVAYIRSAVGLRDFAKQTVRSWRAGEALEQLLPPSPAAASPSMEARQLSCWKRARIQAFARAIMREPVGFPMYFVWRAIIALTPPTMWLSVVDHTKYDTSESTKDLGS